MMKTTIRTIAVVIMFLAAGLLTDGVFNGDMFINEAEARVGRPLTPVSGAGVARRTTRRIIRRTSVYIVTLPRGCTTVIIENVSLHQCGGTYYQPYNNQYVVVNID
jgi:hypothetical protein